jgi:iron-sulfur cluster repair protein YtfE (RIC family)
MFDGLRRELETHIHMEEAILFPFIIRYASAAAQRLPLPMLRKNSARV